MRSEIISFAFLLVFLNEIGAALIPDLRKEYAESQNASFRLSTTEVKESRKLGGITIKPNEPIKINLNQTSASGENISKAFFKSEEISPGPPQTERKYPIRKSPTRKSPSDESPPIPMIQLLGKNTTSSESSTELVVTTEVHQNTTASVFLLQIGTAAIASLAGGGIG